LRVSGLEGFEVPGLTERIVSTMFADDTTVFLKASDSYDLMTGTLESWCKASRAKFNEPKTIIIPVGPLTSRNRLRRDRTLPEGGSRIPESIRILEEGEGTRMLGAWIGPSYDDSTPWKHITEKIGANLARWEKRRPTLKGKRVILNMELGGRTQYLARVQGMPKHVELQLEKMITSFMWGSGRAP
ncbi:hypothetical protein C2E23DRAFT_684198, partial [Lenzites betulinus]